MGMLEAKVSERVREKPVGSRAIGVVGVCKGAEEGLEVVEVAVG